MNIDQLLAAAKAVDREAARPKGPPEPNEIVPDTVPDMVLKHFGTHQRWDGLYAVTDRIVKMYFPAEADADAEARAASGVIINGTNVKLSPGLFPAKDRPGSAFRQFNNHLAGTLAESAAEKAGLSQAQIGGVGVAARADARAKINAAVMAGDIY